MIRMIQQEMREALHRRRIWITVLAMLALDVVGAVVFHERTLAVATCVLR